ncbi:hypothetical protein [Azospirillum doebereinerae]
MEFLVGEFLVGFANHHDAAIMAGIGRSFPMNCPDDKLHFQ